MIRAATDVGGTFTDFAAYDDATKSLIIAKASTKQTIIEAIGDCFAKSGVKPAQLDHFAHGNTVAINIVIEKKGAKTGLITTAGFRDVLEIARGNIPNSFDLMFQTPEPLVPRHLRKEIAERLTVGGKVHTPVDRAEAQATIQSLVDENVELIAICFLHAYANPEHEATVRELVESHNAKLFVTASSDLLRQYREFERTSTTVLNAYVGPRCGRFYDDLRSFLDKASFRGNAVVMQSNGGTMTVETAKLQPVRTMESGPVGGTIAAAHIAKNAGFDSVVAFDMGGTTAKVSIVRNGNVEIADGYTIGPPDMGYPMQLPVVDILEVGSGGGSIAHLDETGLLKVGPVSAGAYPGPACYARGGDQPTVTDADVVLGRLNPDFFLGGEIKLDVARATAAIEKVVAKALGISTIEAASGIARVTDADMAHAVRIMTVQKGHDPRDFVLVAFGGAGPAHAIAIARELGIGKVVIPRHPGIFSAIGMLLADAREDNVLSYVETLDRLDLEHPGSALWRNRDQGHRQIAAVGLCARGHRREPVAGDALCRARIHADRAAGGADFGRPCPRRSAQAVRCVARCALRPRLRRRENRDRQLAIPRPRASREARTRAARCDGRRRRRTDRRAPGLFRGNRLHRLSGLSPREDRDRNRDFRTGGHRRGDVAHRPLSRRPLPAGRHGQSRHRCRRCGGEIAAMNAAAASRRADPI